MKLLTKLLSSLKNRVLAWNKYVQIGASAVLVMFMAVAAMIVSNPDSKPVALTSGKTGSTPQVKQADGTQVTPAPAEATDDQAVQALPSPQAQTQVKSVGTIPTAPNPKPKYDTSTALPVASVNPNALAPYPFFEFVVNPDAATFTSDSVTMPFQIIRHNNPSTPSVSITWINPQGQAPNNVTVRNVQMITATSGVFTLGFTPSSPRNFTVTLTAQSSNAVNSIIVPFEL